MNQFLLCQRVYITVFTYRTYIDIWTYNIKNIITAILVGIK